MSVARSAIAAGTASLAGLDISGERAVLLVVDVQERLAQAMPPAVMAQIERNALILVELARRLALPVVVSQQYPKGLGSTVAALESALAGLAADAVHRLDKLAFSACRDAAFAPIHRALGDRDQWIVIGMETHVCVYQTARDLAASGAAVHVVSDAVASRAKTSWRAGLALSERTGAAVTTTETVVFDALGGAGSDDFKALSRLIR